MRELGLPFILSRTYNLKLSGLFSRSELIKTIVEARILQHKGILGRVEGLLKNMPGLMKPSDDASAFYRRLIASNRDMDFMVSSTVAVMTASCMSACSNECALHAAVY